MHCDGRRGFSHGHCIRMGAGMKLRNMTELVDI